MRTFKMAALVITLSLMAVACDGDAGEGGGKDSGGAEAADGGDEGATDGSADGADGSADGADGSADGADGSDGADGADGADGSDGADGGGTDGEPVDAVVFSDTFEDVAISGGDYTSRGIGCDNWVLTPFDYSGYDIYIGDFAFWVDGGLMRDAAGEFTSSDPLPAPAGGAQMMYLTGYASLPEGSFGGHFDLRDDLVEVEAERLYTLELALGQRTPFTGGDVYVYLYTTGEVEGDNVVSEVAMPIGDLPDGGFSALRLELDPPDSYAGRPLGVRVLLFQDWTGGYTTVAVDNVVISSFEAPAN